MEPPPDGTATDHDAGARMRSTPSDGPGASDTADRPRWHALSAEEVASRVEVDPDRGLDQGEARERLERYGPNRLPEEEGKGPLRRFLEQFHNVLIYILLAAAVFTAFLGEWIDTGVIAAVVLVNAIVGFVQEGKAEQALEGIRALLSLEATVVRGGRRRTIDAEELVPGDVVRLGSGDRVPADLRVVSVRNARVDEAVLTGESEAVEKAPDPVDEEALTGDRRSLAHSGTLVTSGRITGIVVATGPETEIGRIGEMVSRVEKVTTPLLRDIDRFGKQLSVAIVLGAVGIFFVAWLLRGFPPADAFLAVVALAVAAIPEGLPAILTIILALGVQRMARRNAIIRRLPAVETLGSVTVICTDKTGTLTRNEMAVERVLLAHGDWKVTGSGYLPEGGFRRLGEVGDEEGTAEDPGSDLVLMDAVRVGLLCNEAEFSDPEPEEDGSGSRKGRKTGAGEAGRILQGDPTEGALLVLAEKAGLERRREEEERPRLDMIPFESERRWMATLNRWPEDGDPGGGAAAGNGDGSARLLVKGAPERVLEMCRDVRTPEGVEPLDAGAWEERMETVAGEGHRLLALAMGPAPGGDGLSPESVGEELTLLGVVALMDPPRPEAIEAVEICRAAGIRVMMITGDHATTGRSIGARMGIGDGERVLTGAEIERADDDELRENLADHDVIARASPEHKLRIVRLLQEQGQICAMTGDGVNDAPALKQADIGVAMGIKGSEAAKGASEMVLADDNFASIERAVEEGRTVYDNLKKTILFILPTNGAEALIVLAAVTIAFAELPITPAQILWVNMITAVTLALALAFEPPEPGIMDRPPRDPDEPILSRFLLRRIVYVSVVVAVGCIALFQWELARGVGIDYARTSVVNALVAAQLWYLFTCRFKWRPSIGWNALVGNRAVLVAAGLLLVFQAAFTYLPVLNTLFRTEGLDAVSWAPVLSVGLGLYVIVEAEKAWGRRRMREEGDARDR
jgi:magnesium-transporting ATPase (P-type)